ncbi:MAG: HD domain-containing protein [Elusimicrobia bacterium]|nr:HD domain-containing protein [Elusimicrobiota bacterium]
MNLKIPQNYQGIIEKLIKVAKDNNYVIYAVGGFVRDMILNREPKDLDIMVEGENAGIEFSKKVAESLKISQPVTFEKFATSKLEIVGHEIEFIMPRKEYYDENSRNPNTEIGTLQQDALRRDFTVNALFLRLNDFELLDLTGKGMKDIENKIIRVTDETAADIIFAQDPLRILRAVRQSFQLNFKIENKTYQSMKNNAKRIKIVSGERIRDELNKMLLQEKPSQAINMLDDIGMLKEILPELKNTQNITQPTLYHDKDVYGHSLAVLDGVKADIVLRVAALLHDIGKPAVRTEINGKISFISHEKKSVELAQNILLRLKYPAEFIKQVCFLIEQHMYPKNYEPVWKDSAVRKFVYKMGENLENIKDLYFADCGKKQNKNDLFDRVHNLKENNLLVKGEDLIDGIELMKIFGKPQGKWIGDAKNLIKDMQFDNPQITKIEVLEKLKKILKI